MTSQYFTVYSKTDCTYCVKAMNLILEVVGDENNDKVHVIKDPPQEIVERLKEQHNHRTYPFIFVGDKFVGGYTELTEKIGMVENELKEQFDFELEF